MQFSNQVLICWSGEERGRVLAEALGAFLEAVFPGVEAFASTEIPKGRRWFDEVMRRLKAARAGLICLTPEGLDSPWIHYEAGVLEKTLDGKGPYTYLLGVRPDELTGPPGRVPGHRGQPCGHEWLKRSRS